MMENIYIPQQPKTPPVAPAKYVLVDDVTNTGEIDRNPCLTINNKKIRVPHLPNKNCKKCYGRGYIGFDIKHNNNILFCHKCYGKR